MSEALTVLVVDDEKTIREGCRRVLTGKGYAVQTADTGRSCLEAMSRSGADVVLLDLKMPQLSGLRSSAGTIPKSLSSSLPAMAPWTRPWSA